MSEDHTPEWPVRITMDGPDLIPRYRLDCGHCGENVYMVESPDGETPTVPFGWLQECLNAHVHEIHPGGRP